MDVVDFNLIGILWLRILEVLLVLICLVTGRWISDEARDAGWPLPACRAVTAISWVVALGSVGGFVSHTVWLEIGGLAAVAITFLSSGLMTKTISERPVSRITGSERGVDHPATRGETRSDSALTSRKADRWLAFASGAVLGGSAFFGRSLPLGADIVLLGWLASRRPIPVVWISLLGVAVGLVVGGLVTIDPAPLTIGLLAVGFALLAVILRREARANPALPVARRQRR